MFKREVAHTEDMKKFAKYYVFCMINGDQQPAVLQAYNVRGYPTHLITNAEGGELVRSMGYGGPARFYQWLETNK